MRRRADAGRSHVDLARVGLRIGDEFGDGRCGERDIHVHHQGRADDARNRGDIADEIVIELLVERCIDRVRHGEHDKRVAVRRRAHGHFGADVGGGAGPVLDDEWLSEPLGQPLADEAREDVVCATGRKSGNQAHRPARILLCAGKPR